MYPHERSLVKRMADKPFALVGVNSDSSVEKLAEALERENISWPSFFDGGGTSGPIALAWGVRGWPTIYVIDAEGVIRFKNVRGERMDDAVDTLLEEMGVELESESDPQGEPDPQSEPGPEGDGDQGKREESGEKSARIVPAIPLEPAQPVGGE